jgi:hypothetical protein
LSRDWIAQDLTCQDLEAMLSYSFSVPSTQDPVFQILFPFECQRQYRDTTQKFERCWQTMSHYDLFEIYDISHEVDIREYKFSQSITNVFRMCSTFGSGEGMSGQHYLREKYDLLQYVIAFLVLVNPTLLVNLLEMLVSWFGGTISWEASKVTQATRWQTQSNLCFLLRRNLISSQEFCSHWGSSQSKIGLDLAFFNYDLRHMDKHYQSENYFDNLTLFLHRIGISSVQMIASALKDASKNASFSRLHWDHQKSAFLHRAYNQVCKNGDSEQDVVHFLQNHHMDLLVDDDDMMRSRRHLTSD